MNNLKHYTTITSTTDRRGCRLGATLTALLMTASSCGLSTGANSEYAYSCPDEGIGLHVNAYLDLSGTGRADELLGERLDAMQVQLERVVDCEGHATVVGFSDSAASHKVLLDRTFLADGATEIARDLKIPDEIDDAMETIRDNVNIALEVLPSGETDVNAVFVLAGEFADVTDPTVTALEIYVYTDGITTTGPADLNIAGLTESQAVELAGFVVPSDLTNVSEVVIQGVGKVAGDAQPPTDYVNAIKAHLNKLCTQANVNQCTVRTTTVTQ